MKIEKSSDPDGRLKVVEVTFNISDVCYILSALIFAIMIMHAIFSDSNEHTVVGLIAVATGWVLLIVGSIIKAIKDE